MRDSWTEENVICNGLTEDYDDISLNLESSIQIYSQNMKVIVYIQYKKYEKLKEIKVKLVTVLFSNFPFPYLLLRSK
jgi:hypothetical protein